MSLLKARWNLPVSATLIVLTAAVAFVSLSVGRAHASPTTFAFAGSVDVGSNFYGSYTFESEAVDSTPLDPHVGNYLSSGGPYGGHLEFGGFTIDFSTVSITVQNDGVGGLGALGSDVYRITGFGGTDGSFFFFLQDCSGTGFVNKNLPTTPPDLGLFKGPSDCAGGFVPAEVVINDFNPNFQTFGSLSSFVRVPEPLSLLLLGVGLIALAAWARRKTA